VFCYVTQLSHSIENMKMNILASGRLAQSLHRRIESRGGPDRQTSLSPRRGTGGDAFAAADYRRAHLLSARYVEGTDREPNVHVIDNGRDIALAA
jgi:hypothetical protein